METTQIAKVLEGITSQATKWEDIGQLLRNQYLTNQNSEHPLWGFVFAFEYMYVEGEGDYYKRYGRFAPWIEMQGIIFPPPLNTLSNEVLSEWAKVLELIRHPVLVSRLSDLLWIRKWGQKPYLYAVKAINAYLSLSDQFEPLYQAYGLKRALELSSEICDQELKNKSIAKIIRSCNNELRSPDFRPGVFLRLIQSLLKLPPHEVPTEVDDLLQSAIERYKDYAWIANMIYELMSKRAPQEQKIQFRMMQVRRWEEEAEKSVSGLEKIAHLQKALEIAVNFGLKEKVQELRVKIQSISPEDEMHRIPIEIQVPVEKIEKFINSFVRQNWQESLTWFGAYGPPSGDYQENVEKVERLSQNFPLQFLISQVVLDENGFPIQYAKTIEENKELALVRQEIIGIHLFSIFAPHILERIIKTHGIPDYNELKKFFTTEMISEDIAGTIAKAIHWYFQEEFNVCAYLITPAIEAVLRNVVRELGFAVIKEPVGNNPGGVVTLGVILEMLRDRMDESWRRYFYNLLSNSIGVNLRNRICHGLLFEVEREYASLLVHVVCHLRLLEVKKTPTEE